MWSRKKCVKKCFFIIIIIRTGLMRPLSKSFCFYSFFEVLKPQWLIFLKNSCEIFYKHWHKTNVLFFFIPSYSTFISSSLMRDNKHLQKKSLFFIIVWYCFSSSSLLCFLKEIIFETIIKRKKNSYLVM